MTHEVQMTIYFKMKQKFEEQLWQNKIYAPVEEIKDNNEFIKKLRYLMSDIQKLSQKSLSELIAGGSYPHCHKTKYEENRYRLRQSIW